MGCLLLCFTPMRIIFRLPSSKLAYNCMTMENRWTSQLWRYNTAILLKCVGTTFFHVGGLTWLAAERNGTKCCKNNAESGRVHKTKHTTLFKHETSTSFDKNSCNAMGNTAMTSRITCINFGRGTGGNNMKQPQKAKSCSDGTAQDMSKDMSTDLKNHTC